MARRCCLAFPYGISDFDGLHSGKYDEEMRLYAFDILALDGDDPRKLPLSLRKQHFERLLKLLPNGIFVALFEHGEIRPKLFRGTCSSGLESILSNWADRRYRAGRSKD
jgi:bifunctional non-homologous end joining protein LigD